jgi:hypothetical protein
MLRAGSYREGTKHNERRQQYESSAFAMPENGAIDFRQVRRCKRSLCAWPVLQSSRHPRLRSISVVMPLNAEGMLISPLIMNPDVGGGESSWPNQLRARITG